MEDYVELKTWVGHQNLRKYFEESNVCVIPQPYNDYINTTIPHKLFEYMSQAKPVIVSDAKPLKRIVEETGAGLVFNSYDQVSFAEQVLKIYADPSDFLVKMVNLLSKKNITGKLKKKNFLAFTIH